jgi:hypothetical protein
LGAMTWYRGVESPSTSMLTATGGLP